MTFTSITDMYFVQTGLTNVMKFTPARYFNVSTTWIDFSVSSIGNSIPFQPVRFMDSDGVSFNSTFIYNEGQAPQPLDCGVTGALIINDDVVINGTLVVRGFVIASNVDGTCPIIPSDARVKRDIAHADTELAYERITHMPLKSFRYTPEYMNTQGRPSHLQPNTTYVGVIAQEVARDFGYMVSKGRARLGDIHVPDMHSIHPELLFGEVVGALQHVRKLHESLEARMERAEQLIGHAALRSARAMERAGRQVKDAFEDSGHEALVQLGRQVDRGEQLTHSAETKIHKALSYLHSRLQRIEKAVVDT